MGTSGTTFHPLQSILLDFSNCFSSVSGWLIIIHIKINWMTHFIDVFIHGCDYFNRFYIDDLT